MLLFSPGNWEPFVQCTLLETRQILEVHFTGQETRKASFVYLGSTAGLLSSQARDFLTSPFDWRNSLQVKHRKSICLSHFTYVYIMNDESWYNKNSLTTYERYCKLTRISNIKTIKTVCPKEENYRNTWLKTEPWKWLSWSYQRASWPGKYLSFLNKNRI